jgi:hypothetical protein
VKPRWEGPAKGIRASSVVEIRQRLVREVGRVVGEHRRPALLEPFLPGAEFTVALMGHARVRLLLVLQRALDPKSSIGLHGLSGAIPDAAWCLPGEFDAALEGELGRLPLRAAFPWDQPAADLCTRRHLCDLCRLAGRGHEHLLSWMIEQPLLRRGLLAHGPASSPRRAAR